MGNSNSSDKSTLNVSDGNSETMQIVLQDEEITTHLKEEKEEERIPSVREERRIDEACLGAIYNAMHHIISLQKTASTAGIEARMAYRRSSNKRQDVWESDLRFMDEIRRLMASETVADFGEISKLALDCQQARDDLGPVEQETIEKEQNWEGAMYRLHEAETNFDRQFEQVFISLNELASERPESFISSPYRTSSEPGSHNEQIFTENDRRMPYRVFGSTMSESSHPIYLPQTTDTEHIDEDIFSMEDMLRGMNENTKEQGLKVEYEEEAVSGIGNIYEDFADTSPHQCTLGKKATYSQREDISSITLLLTEFSSPSNRIDRWLAYTLLLSSFETLKLCDIVSSQVEGNVPSNWAQLVIAYWEVKEKPGVKAMEMTNQKESSEGPSSKVAIQENTLVTPPSRSALQEASYDVHLNTFVPQKHIADESWRELVLQGTEFDTPSKSLPAENRLLEVDGGTVALPSKMDSIDRDKSDFIDSILYDNQYRHGTPPRRRAKSLGSVVATAHSGSDFAYVRSSTIPRGFFGNFSDQRSNKGQEPP